MNHRRNRGFRRGDEFSFEHAEFEVPMSQPNAIWQLKIKDLKLRREISIGVTIGDHRYDNNCLIHGEKINFLKKGRVYYHLRNSEEYNM